MVIMGRQESRNMFPFTYKEMTTLFPTVTEPPYLTVARDSY